MKYGLYVMRDVKTTYLTPNVDVNDMSAMRNFENAIIRSKESVLNTHASDFELYKIGEFDNSTGVITSQTPEILCSGSDFKKE